jgi:hypothetical protein
MRGEVGTMAVPPILVEIYEALAGIFTGAARITFLAILILLLTKFFFDIITDWLFKDIKKYFYIFFFPGSWSHQLWHSLVIRMLGYDVRVNFHMSMTLRDVTSQSLSGDLNKVSHAFLIGIAPVMNFVIVIILLIFNVDFKNFFVWIDFSWGYLLIVYLIISFVYFGLPDFADLMLPFTTATAKNAELIFLLLFGIINFIIGMGIWGYLIPLINLILYVIACIYLAEKKVFDRSFKPFKKGFEETEKESNASK